MMLDKIRERSLENIKFLISYTSIAIETFVLSLEKAIWPSVQ